jgi:hypothetical protein
VSKNQWERRAKLKVSDAAEVFPEDKNIAVLFCGKSGNKLGSWEAGNKHGSWK